MQQQQPQRTTMGRFVTLAMLRTLREAGHFPVGMELLLHTHDAAGTPGWHFGQVRLTRTHP